MCSKVNNRGAPKRRSRSNRVARLASSDARKKQDLRPGMDVVCHLKGENPVWPDSANARGCQNVHATRPVRRCLDPNHLRTASGTASATNGLASGCPLSFLHTIGLLVCEDLAAAEQRRRTVKMKNKIINHRVIRPLAFAWMSLFSVALTAMAEDLYVGQTAAGSEAGIDAANRRSMAWLNAAGNWGTGAGKVSPGDTVHLVGTFTAPLRVAGSGTAGNIITILFEPGANFTAGCWPAAGAIQLDGISYLTIDGGVDGVIRNTSNGTRNSTVNGVIQTPNNGAMLATQNNSRGIGGNGNGTALLNHGVIRNLKITHIYRKEIGVLDDTRAGYCIDVSGTDIVIEGNNVSDGDGLIGYAATTDASNIYIRNNVLRDYNHGITIGVGDSNCTLTNIVISGNDLDHSDTWDCPNSQIHLDAIIILNNGYNATSVIDGFRICGNHFGPHVGTFSTAAVFNSMQGQSIQSKNWYIYNNLFECQANNAWGNGFITCSGTNLRIFNNSMMGTTAGGRNFGGGVQFGGTNALLKNNIIQSGISVFGATTDTVAQSSNGISTASVLNAYFGTVYSDHNIIFGTDPTFGAVLWTYQPAGTQWLGGSLNGLHAWQTWYDNNRSMQVPIWNKVHADPRSSTTVPRFVPGTFVPVSDDTAARGKGENLRALFAELGLPATDYNGNPRPATGPWTIGAFESAATGADMVNPAVTISGPVATTTYTSTTATLNLAGTATDNVGVTQVTWSSDRGGNGTAGGTANWSVNEIPLLGGPNVLTVTVRDAAGNSATDTLTVTYTPPDTVSPVVAISSPVTTATYTSTTATLNLAGAATDDVGVTQVTWSSDRGGGGTAGGTPASWTVSGIVLLSGPNVLTVTARDAAGNSATDTLTVTYTPPVTSDRLPKVAFDAEGGVLTAPFVSDGSAVFQPYGTDLAISGRASYQFAVSEPGEYAFSVLVDAPSEASNSFFLNVDAEPQDPQMVWDIQVTTGFQQRFVSWRGNGTFDNNEFRPKYFTLGIGQHELIIRGREGNVSLDSITIVKRPSRPTSIVRQ